MSEARADARNLTWWQFLLLVVVYAAIIQVGGRVIGADVTRTRAGPRRGTSWRPR